MNEFKEKLIGRLKRKHIPYLGMDSSVPYGTEMVRLFDAIEIVNQLAEEYKTCHKPCTDCEEYDLVRNHCPKFCKVIKETVKEIEENHSGWIPYSERLPEVSGEYYTYVYYDGHYMYAIDEIDCDGMIKKWNCVSDYQIIAWKPIEPYQSKGE